MGLRAGVKKTFRLAMPCNSPGCSFQAKTQTPQCPTPLCPGRLFEDGGVGFLCLSGRSDAAPICLQAGLEQGPFKAPHLLGGPRHVLVLTSFRDLRPCAAAHAGACQAGHPWSLHSCHLLSARPGALPPAGAPATQQSRPSSSQAAAANGTLSAYSADEEIAIKGG